MTKYVLKRLLYMVIVFLLVSLLMYSIYNLIPTDPARAQLEPMKTSLKPAEYEQRYQMLRQQMGLNDPLIVRYLRWIGFWPDVNGKLDGMLQGNFGYSQIYKTDVANVLPSRMLNTIYINIFSTLVALAITIPLGIYCAVHKRSKTDNAVQVLSIVGYSIPVYIIALIFIWLFAVTLRWLPVFGMQTPGNNFTGFRAFLDKVYYMTLPVLVMTVGSLGGMTRYVRAAMIEALSMDYIKGFQVIYTNLNSYIEEDLPLLASTGVPIAYDFSVRWTDEYLARVCPYIQVALLSCAHLNAQRREEEMRKVAALGVPVVLGTIGEDGSYVLYNGRFSFANAVHADNVIDTMGAGDSYFAAFLCHLLDISESGRLLEGTVEENTRSLRDAMEKGAAFAAKVCAMEGAFGYGTPIAGRTEL